MRWPLKYQIFLPFTVLLLGTVAMVSALDAWLSARAHRQAVQGQLRNIAATLAPGEFPLTPPVLGQTHGLSGAHFVVATRSGDVLAASDPDLDAVPHNVLVQDPAALELGDALEINDARFLHAAVKLRPRFAGDPASHLHILYPEQTWQQAWRENVYPPLITGGVAIVLAMLVSALLAARMSRPIDRLRAQAEKIATGDYQPLPEPKRLDEIRDLVLAVNRMALTLAEYEEQARRDERLKALGQLRGGLAHELRNAVTGCRMALDLHRMRAKADGETSESLAVAHRQLVLIERHLEQFLKFGEDTQATNLQPIDLHKIVVEVLPLVRPAAEHAHVQVELTGAQAALVQGDQAALEQVLINLLVNAIEAAAAEQSIAGDDNQRRIVRLSIEENDRHIHLTVSDNGRGPSPSIADTLFEPLVTDKPQGTGLGLAVARDTVARHQGELRWRREGDWTHFVVELPALPKNVASTLRGEATPPYEQVATR